MPQYEKAVQKARVTEAMGILKKIVDNIDMCVLANGGTDNCDEDIVFEGLEQFANNGGLSTKNFDYGTYGFALAMDKQQNYTLALASHTMEEIVGAPEGRWCLPGTEKGLAFCKSLSGKAIPRSAGKLYNKNPALRRGFCVLLQFFEEPLKRGLSFGRTLIYAGVFQHPRKHFAHFRAQNFRRVLGGKRVFFQ